MRKQKTKGDRLNWTPLREVTTVRLNETLTKGRRVEKVSVNKKKLLVP